MANDGTGYFGLSRLGWYSLTPEERVIHYNRQNICEHKADLLSWPEALRENCSLDPYANTSHMLPHQSEESCECQMCERQIGIERPTIAQNRA